MSSVLVAADGDDGSKNGERRFWMKPEQMMKGEG
jgi:hypothetical protein